MQSYNGSDFTKKTSCDAAVLTVVVGVSQGTSGPDPTTVYVDMRALRHDR